MVRCDSGERGILTRTLGRDLKARRTAAGLTQSSVAEHLGVSRPTLTHWESDKYRPSSDNLTKLDQLYGAQGELIRLAEGQQQDAEGERTRSLFIADIFQGAADALVNAVAVEDGRQQGWARNLTARSPGPLSTAYVLRTLQLLDEVRVDLHSIGDYLERNQGEAGWSYRVGGPARPEVTAVILAALARLGRLTDLDAALRMLENLIDDFAKTRPFVLAVALEAVLAIRPDSDLAHQLTRDLLGSRAQHKDRMLWSMNASSLVEERTSPSLAHTARATAILRLARPTTGVPTQVDDAIDMAVEWMSSLHKSDAGAIELLEVSETQPAIPNHHFTSAWVIRSLAGVKGVPASRLQAALEFLWDSYSPTDKLWIWRDEGSLPSWMTHDAVSALRALAEASLSSPFTTGGDS